MPPVKTPAPPPNANAAGVALALFAQNLEEIRRWYRASSTSGHDVGHIVMQELVMANVSTALTLALEGKRWQAPGNSP